jgi:thymidylate synthase
MREYKEMLKAVHKYGFEVPIARDKMPETKMLNSLMGTFPLTNGLPILTGKTMPFYSIIGELIGFMKGVTDVREFDKLGTKVWWDNAYKWNVADFNKRGLEIPSVTLEEYKRGNTVHNSYYNLGRIYSAQWRKWKGVAKDKSKVKVDQLEAIIANINQQPYSRYHVMTAWNPAEMNSSEVSQPNCHVYFQASCSPIKNVDENFIRWILGKTLTDDTIDELLSIGYNPDKYILSHLTQRSCDMFLGVPFNITSYSIFTILLSIFTNSIPYEFKWIGVNSHIYNNHKEQVEAYLSKPTFTLPKLRITGIRSLADIEAITTLEQVKQHFKLVNYTSSGKIEAPLSVGL